MEQKPNREIKLSIGNALIVQPSGVVFLGQNNKYAHCPYRQPLIIQEFVSQDISLLNKGNEPIVQNKIQEQSCGDWCPHFSIIRSDADGTAEVRLTCGSVVVKKIQKIIEAPTSKLSKA